MSTHWSSSLQVYTLHSGSLPMTLVCEGTSTRPSIADLLEWLSDLERIHSELYEEKVDILGRITYIAPMAIVCKAVRDWVSSQHRHAHKIRDIMEQVAVFLANRTWKQIDFWDRLCWKCSPRHRCTVIERPVCYLYGYAVGRDDELRRNGDMKIRYRSLGVVCTVIKLPVLFVEFVFVVYKFSVSPDTCHL